jgi:hypothetical protein
MATGYMSSLPILASLQKGGVLETHKSELSGFVTFIRLDNAFTEDSKVFSPFHYVSSLLLEENFISEE